MFSSYPAGDDYLGVAPFSATFASGETSATVVIPIRDDSVLERLESFFAGLSIPGPAASLGVKAGERDNATVYIDDNDSVEVVFDPISYNVSESDGEVNLTLRANSTASFDYTVQVDTSDGSATGGIICTWFSCTYPSVSWCDEWGTIYIYTVYMFIVQYTILCMIERCLLISCLAITQLILTMKPVW